MRSKLILWDIDGTLLSTHGAGMRAMGRAAVHVFGASFTFEGVPAAGNLDPLILTAAAQRCGVEIADHHHGSFLEHYCRILPEELAASGQNLRVMPAVHSTLARMREDPRLVLGLLTGNYSATARLKLCAASIDPGWFDVGAFGEDGGNRPSLVPVAMGRCRNLRGLELTPAQVVVIGDTPRDVHTARVNGCRSVGVATGPYSQEDLRGAGADLVIPDLREAEGLWRLIDEA